MAELKVPLKIKWRRGKNTPSGVDGPVKAVTVVGNNVYVGGEFVDVPAVMVYSLQNGSWSRLPYDSEALCFGTCSMVAMNDRLVTVDGGTLGVWDEQSQTWTSPFPQMPTVRHSPSIVSYKKWLVVAGGKVEYYGDANHSRRIDLLDTFSQQWYQGSPLPYGCSEMSSAISGNMLYLLGGVSSQVLSVCLDELIFQAVSQSAGATSPPTPSPWQTLPETPLTHSAVLILKGALLAVGGLWSSSIHLYQPTSKSWVKAGNLPMARPSFVREQCACTVLPSGEVFVASGGGFETVCCRVDIATIV